MERVQYNVVERDTRNASGKAKVDVTKILSRNGFKKMYRPSAYRPIRVAQQLGAISRMKENSCVFVQYPANIDFCYRALAKKHCRKVAIIHDMESLRNEKTVEEEMSILKMFDIIISHNQRMTDYMRQNGITGEIIELNIFDYLMDGDFKVIENHDKSCVAFAGNLSKAGFLSGLNEIGDIKFLIYGNEVPGIDRIRNQENVEYKGSFASDKLLEVLEGGWGLVWDGDNLDACSGTTGEYMRYNCPHKVSMYVATERPIIIWEGAAMSKYVVSHKLGISVPSLRALREAVSRVSDTEYNEMLCNIRNEKDRLIKGGTLEEILRKYICGKIC